MAGKKKGIWNIYNNGKAKNKSCPKCSTFLAEHKDRLTCGKCHYVEYKDKKAKPETRFPSKQLAEKKRVANSEDYVTEL